MSNSSRQRALGNGLTASLRTVLEDAARAGEPVLRLANVRGRLGAADERELSQAIEAVALTYTTERGDKLVTLRGAATKTARSHAAGAIARHDAIVVDAFTRARKRSKSSDAFSAAQLIKNLPKMPRNYGKPFEDAFRAALAERNAAQEILAIRIAGRPHYFFVGDIVPQLAIQKPAAGHDSHRAPNGVPHEPVKIDAHDFSRRFESAFARLDRASGSHNLVSLVDLRRELADVPRRAFDEALQDLRRARRFSLNSADGRHGTSPEEREAGIVEEDALLLFASRRDAGGVT